MMVATELAVAIVLGTAFGLGVCLLLARLPRIGATSLSRRVAPYVRDVVDPRGVVVEGTGPGWDSAMLGRRAAEVLGRAVGSSETIERRLRQAGRPIDVTAFRARQLGWTLAGFGIGAAGAVALVLLGRASAASVLLPVVGGVAAFLLCDHLLSRAASARLARIGEELPTVLEFLALCLSAGEGILDSLRRVSAVGAGELTGEVRVAVVEVGTGSSLSEALAGMSRRIALPAVSRSIDQIVAAIDRGAPLADVLHAQASDAREDAKRALLESAGRKEIAMLVPQTIA
ncbi:type II secretion system F family protein [Microbacterium sp. SSW1-59]|uniref:type II secretion system F family protein n=1 Tax=Microbacterium xanthum TaxID=3079794 RepID=UPI002AD58A50|nr:type II secretion system F family protein [Microbacterium sp. SSW1-59]MDZ8202089.1 type II secretion system F family protein [Microbacterium sp. SSW1-59]